MWRFCCISLLALLPHLAYCSSEAEDAVVLVQAAEEEEDVPAGSDEEEIPAGGKPVTPEMEEKVRAFLDHFVDAEKTPAEQAELFAERAEYYEHGYVGRQEIQRDVQRYVKHWPYRHYVVTDISYMSADPASDRVFVSYTLAYEVARGTRTASGRASYGVVIKDLEHDPKVESIKERVHGRRPASNG